MPRTAPTCVSIALLAWAAPCPAQPSPPPRFADNVAVELVNLDVVVTDRQGKRITDLTAADFEVREGGKKREITHFEPRGTASLGARSEGGGPVEAREPLHLVIFLDNAHTGLAAKKAAIEQLQQLVAEQLGPQDRVLLASFERSLSIHQPFTTDREALARGFASLNATISLTSEADQDLEHFFDQLETFIGDGDCTELIEPAVAQYSAAVGHRVLSALDAASDLMRVLAAVPGRKALVYVSEGLQLRPGSFLIRLMASITSLCRDFAIGLRTENSSLAFALKNVGAVANASRVTFYPLDIGGARRGPAGGRRPQVAGELRASLQDSLTFLASETGGRAFLDVLDLEPVWRDLVHDQDGSYSLAFPAPESRASELRWLEVKVKRRGAEARFRRSWRDRSAEDRLREQLLAAVWLGASPNPLGLRAEIAEPAVPTDSGFYLAMRLGVPLGNVALVPEGTDHLGKLRVLVLTRSADGSETAPSEAVLPLRVPSDQVEAARTQLWGHTVRLVLRPGKHKLAFAVTDLTTTQTSVVVAELELGPVLASTPPPAP
jgi:VWFA-related protein